MVRMRSSVRFRLRAPRRNPPNWLIFSGSGDFSFPFGKRKFSVFRRVLMIFCVALGYFRATFGGYFMVTVLPFSRLLRAGT